MFDRIAILPKSTLQPVMQSGKNSITVEELPISDVANNYLQQATVAGLIWPKTQL